MARYAYDVDSRTKLLDTHKQFSGGLKTVDTDDSLKTVYMRDMQNISLSEYGFLEKRYGQYLDKELEGLTITKDSLLQGLFSYTHDNGTDEIAFVDGTLYLKRYNETTFTAQTIIRYEEEDRIPSLEILEGLNIVPKPFPKVIFEDITVGDLVSSGGIYLALPEYWQDSRHVFSGLTGKEYYWVPQEEAWYETGNIYEELKFDNLEDGAYYEDSTGEGIRYHYSETVLKGYFTGVITLVYSAQFQETREIEATRIDDNLYMMTGTYPIYYKGDGNFYLMPIYEPTTSEVQEFSHNMLENDFEDLYRFTYTMPTLTIDTAPTSADLEDSDTGIVKNSDISISPLFPYNNEDDDTDESSGLTISIDYKINLNDYELVKPFERFYVEVEDSYDIESNSDVVYILSRSAHYLKNFNNMDDAFKDDEEFLTIPANAEWWNNLSGKDSKPYKDLHIDTSRDLTEVMYRNIIDNPINQGIAGSGYAFSWEEEPAEDDIIITADLGSNPFNHTTPSNVVYKDFWRKTMGAYEDELPFQPDEVFRIAWLSNTTLHNNTPMIQFAYVKFVGKGGNDSEEQYYDAYGAFNGMLPQNIIKPTENEDEIVMTYITTSWGFQYVADATDSPPSFKKTIKTKPPTISLSAPPYIKSWGDSNGYNTERPQSNYIYWELFPAVFTRPTGGTEAEWVEISKDYYEGRKVYANIPDMDADINFSVISPNVNTSISDDDYNYVVTPLEELSGSILDNIEPFNFRITKLPYGNLDIKTALIVRKSGYYDDVSGLTYENTISPDPALATLVNTTLHKWKQESFPVVEYVLRSVVVSNQKLDDYNDIPKYDTLPDVWSCNKVFNHYGKLLAYGSLKAPDYLYVSHPSYHNYFPYFFSMKFKTDSRQAITSINSFQNVLVVQSATQTWGLSGVDAISGLASSYNQFTISPIYGTIAPKSVKPVRNHLYFLSLDGIVALKALYATDQIYNVEILDKNIRNIVPFDDPDAVGIQWDDQYWLQFPSTGETFRYYVDKKAWVRDVYFDREVETDADYIDFQGIHEYQRISGKYLGYISKPMLKKGTSESYSIYKIIIDKDIPTDLTHNIFSSFETSFLNQEYPFHPKQYKEVKFDFTLQNEYNTSVAPVIDDTEPIELVEATLIKNHYYVLDMGEQQISYINFNETLLEYEEVFTEATEEVNVDNYSYYFYFNEEDTTSYFDIGDNTYVGTLSDATYDPAIYFKIWAFTEDNALNLDNETSTTYEATFSPVEDALGTKFGIWDFGSGVFGNRTTATKTVRLAGKGKNIKVYFEEEGKTKWTLETLGIMFKLKRARGTR